MHLLSPVRAFQQTVETGSVRRASERLGLLPSTVSRQISVFEQQLGTKLFKRSVDGMVLTHAGTLVAEYARNTLLEHRRLLENIDRARDQSRQVIRVASVESCLLGAIPDFLDANPTAVLHAVQADISVVLESVKNGQSHVGVNISDEVEPDLRLVAAFNEPIELLVRNDHSILRKKHNLALASLCEVPLALPSAGYCIRTIFDKVARAEGIDVVPRLETSSLGVACDFAARGKGATLISRRVVPKLEDHRLVMVPIAHPVMRRTTVQVVVARGRYTSRSSRAFVKALTSFIKAM
jgi:DNA-binding transcriptional LysR family regulator